MQDNLIILGSTGSIGKNVCAIAKEHNLNVLALSTNTRIDILKEQIELFSPKFAVVCDKDAFYKLTNNGAFSHTTLLCGYENLNKIASLEGYVINALVGSAGLNPTYHAIKAKNNIALANKETLVCAGSIIMKMAKEAGVTIFPVDSEHSALFSVLEQEENIKRFIITASGGPFYGFSKSQLESVKAKDALKHPNWDMGAKITIDSATLMNKGFEIIEAHHLFDIELEKIDYCIHRESIIHSMIEFNDNSVKAYLSHPSMKIPILYALSYPDRFNCDVPSLSFDKAMKLSFDKVDNTVFDGINICIESQKKNKFSNAIVNAANEVAVKLFLEDKIGFLDITKINKKAMEEFSFDCDFTIENILNVDKEVKAKVLEFWAKS